MISEMIAEYVTIYASIGAMGMFLWASIDGKPHWAICTIAWPIGLLVAAITLVKISYREIKEALLS